MFKKTITVVVLLIMSLSLITAVQAEEAPKLVSQVNSVILIEPGKELDVSSYLFEFPEQLIEGAQVRLTTSEQKLTINGSNIKAEEEGVFLLKAQYEEQSMDIYAVSGGTLFYDDFSSGLSDQYRIVEGSNVRAEDGFLYVGPSCRVLLPEFLDNLGNYIIECRATIIQPNESTRWASVMYRIQKEDYPYYQMCIRSGATAANGVEFAERTTQNAWNVTNTASYSENISPSQMYDIRIEANGANVNQYINQTLTQSVHNAAVWNKGGIGLQANGSTMKIDSIKVTAVQDQYETVYGYAQLSTPLKTDYSSSVLAVKPDTAEQIKSYASMDESKRPTAVMVEVNDNLTLSTYSQKDLGGIEDFLAMLNNRIIPVFRAKEADTAQALAQKLSEINFPDAYILSSKEGLIKAKETYYNFYGLLDLSGASGEITDDTLAQIRADVNSANAKSVLLPEEYALKSYIQTLQKGVISVWLDASEQTDITAACRLLSCGANGYAVFEPDILIDAMDYFSQDAMLRKTVIIGHRGIPALAPENTLEGAVKAYENGSDIVEVDVYVTTDNQLVILHDGDLSRTTTGTGNIENYSLAQLKEFLANKQFPNNPEYADCRIPTMREFFEEFKDTDMGFFIEIKSGKANCLPLLKELIDEYADYNMESRCTVISFLMNQIVNSRKNLPGVSASYLCGGLITDDSIYTSLYGINEQLLPNNATFSTSYGGVGALSIEALALRGITTWPWTFTSMADYYSYFKTNAGGLTTNYSNWSKDLAHTLNVPAQSVNLEINKTQAAQGSLTTYARQTLELPENTELIILSGQDVISADGLNITGLKEGAASYMLKTSVNNRGGMNYTLYSQPVTVSVSADGGATATETQPAAQPQALNGALPYVIGACALVIIAAAAIVIFTLKGRKKK